MTRQKSRNDGWALVIGDDFVAVIIFFFSFFIRELLFRYKFSVKMSKTLLYFRNDTLHMKGNKQCGTQPWDGTQYVMQA